MQRQKKCYVCEKPNCWSIKHSGEECQRAYAKFRQLAQHTTNQEPTVAYFNSFLANFEGVEGLSEGPDLTEAEQLMIEMESEGNENEGFFTEFGEINSMQTVASLNDQSIMHSFTKTDIFCE